MPRLAVAGEAQVALVAQEHRRAAARARCSISREVRREPPDRATRRRSATSRYPPACMREHALHAAPHVVRRVVDRNDDVDRRAPTVARSCAARIRFHHRRTRSHGSSSHQRALCAVRDDPLLRGDRALAGVRSRCARHRAATRRACVAARRASARAPASPHPSRCVAMLAHRARRRSLAMMHGRSLRDRCRVARRCSSASSRITSRACASMRCELARRRVGEQRQARDTSPAAPPRRAQRRRRSTSPREAAPANAVAASPARSRRSGRSLLLGPERRAQVAPLTIPALRGKCRVEQRASSSRSSSCRWNGLT